MCAQLCLTLCDSMNHSLPCSSVRGIFQARILPFHGKEWIAMPSSRGSSQSRDRTLVSCIAGGFFTTDATWEPREIETYLLYTHTHTHTCMHTHTHTHTHTITPVVELYLLRQVYVEGVFFLLSAGVRRSLFFNLLEKNIGLYYFWRPSSLKNVSHSVNLNCLNQHFYIFFYPSVLSLCRQRSE